MKSDITTTSSNGIDLDEIELARRQSVLVVDDDPDTVFLLKQILRTGGFDVMGAQSSQEAMNKFVKSEPDLILLDLMMPDIDGWETFAQVRKMANVPVIIISAISGKDDVVRGLHVGADDYITKPFFNAEVVERVKAVLRRAGKQSELSRMVFPKAGLVIDLTNQRILIHDHEVYLTPKEFSLMSLLAKHSPATVSYDTISAEVFDGSPNVRKRANYLVHLLRRKLEGIEAAQDLIVNVGRLGYRLQVEQ